MRMQSCRGVGRGKAVGRCFVFSSAGAGGGGGNEISCSWRLENKAERTQAMAFDKTRALRAKLVGFSECGFEVSCVLKWCIQFIVVV